MSCPLPSPADRVKEAALEFFLKVNIENENVSKGAVMCRDTVGAGGSSSVTRRIKSLCTVGRNQTGSWKGQRQAQHMPPS